MNRNQTLKNARITSLQKNSNRNKNEISPDPS